MAPRERLHAFQVAIDLVYEFRNEKRFTGDLVEADGIHEKLGTDEQAQVTGVEFGNQHFLVATEDFAEVAWERIHVAQMSVGDRLSRRESLQHCRSHGAVRAAPTEQEQLAFFGAFHFLARYREISREAQERAEAARQKASGGGTGSTEHAAAVASL